MPSYYSRTKRLSRLILGLLFMLSVSVVEGDDTTLDRIFLTDGSQIFGTVLGASKGQVEIRTEFSGILMISADQIESLYSGQPLVLQLKDGRLLKAQPISIAHRKFVVTTAGGDHTTYSVSDIKSINPEPWMLGQGFKWSGFVSFSWDIESGNTDKNELDYLLDTKWRKGSARWILKGEGELDKVSNEKNADNWTLMAKSDHFLTDTRYWGAALYLESDQFADLDRRTFVGGYYGWQWFGKPRFTLMTEPGLAYVTEDFIVASVEKKYISSTWNIDASSNMLGKKTRLYLNQVGVWNLEATEDLVLNTRVGLSVPLLRKVEVAAEIKLEFDSGAPEGFEELDQTYKIRLGYRW